MSHTIISQYIIMRHPSHLFNKFCKFPSERRNSKNPDVTSKSHCTSQYYCTGPLPAQHCFYFSGPASTSGGFSQMAVLDTHSHIL